MKIVTIVVRVAMIYKYFYCNYIYSMCHLLTRQYLYCLYIYASKKGARILGMEEKRPNWDKIGANMNSVRTTTLIKDADIVVVRFGEKYRQWNAVRLLLFDYRFLG